MVDYGDMQPKQLLAVGGCVSWSGSGIFDATKISLNLVGSLSDQFDHRFVVCNRGHAPKTDQAEMTKSLSFTEGSLAHPACAAAA